VLPDGEHVMTWMEIQSAMIDAAWARTVAEGPARILERIAKAEDDMPVGELIKVV
jgi:hypothetical protein